MTDTVPTPAPEPVDAPVEVPIDDVLARYGRELAAMTQRAVLAEAQVQALLNARH
ncbi:hypothetical protein [Sanguibacter sp. HDW7]|uniref:hypothetical protein n=1 Tax=Sanguibacter sp. HDW7 TaxID=2714931 RepID=UPI0014076D3D|nr:hypothetical protein [Sanguibacter sp. HDW7]QIK82981.1 hypothetical protein G7063_04580 [Sanguibacter sp. HDW7]